MSLPTSAFPAPVYRDTVLRHVFADAQRLFLPSLLEINLAHVLMLGQQGILTTEQAAGCLRGILQLDQQALLDAKYDGSVEDLFFLVERFLAEAIGEDLAGRIHTARSRNDLDLTMYRMVLREYLLDTLEANATLRAVLLGIAMQYRSALMPAYTHSQPAQPTTLGHFLMAYIEVLERDTERLCASYARVNRSPLGACAITTTGFAIHRHHTAQRLGVRGLVVNSYGAIAAVDYVAEAAGALATAMLSLGRFAQEMLLWSTAEFGYLRLSDGYVQISSLMPQKRNPVPLEHVRVLASRALTEAQAVLGTLHNTPFADMNDGEDALQPLIALAFGDAQRAMALLAGALGEATFLVERMRERAHGNFLSVTELADTLVRCTGLSFHDAHRMVSSAVRRAGSDDPAALARIVFEQATAAGLHVTVAELEQALEPEYFIAVRGVVGGPAPSALDPELQRATVQLQNDRTWLNAEREHLRITRNKLLTEAQRLAGATAGTSAR